jgi:phosphoribosylaminoimidazole carboxylase (NCAIR synthetase)
MEVLLIGSSFSAVPMLQALKKRGANVTVIGKHEDDPCHAYADRSIFEDYSDSNTLLTVCQQNRFDYIVPTCNDYSYLAASDVAAELGFSGLDDQETTSIIHTKDHFRRFCARIGVPAPKTYGEVSNGQRELMADLEGPALVKPVDSFSGRGVQVIYDAKELPGAVDRALAQSRRGNVVIEQFVDGALHSHTAFISSGRVIWHDFVDEFCEIYPYQVDRSAYPSSLSTEMRVNVNTCIEKIVSALNLCDGLLHTQFIASAADFWIIECMRRCPGDLYGHHFKLALDYDYESQYVAGFVGAVPKPPEMPTNSTSVGRQIISVDQEQAFFGISLDPGVRKMTYVPLKLSGEKLGPAPFDKAGIMFFQDVSPPSKLVDSPVPRIGVYENLFTSASTTQN